MNRLEQDIRAALVDVGPGEGGERIARFVFPPGFLGFQGHFPGNPVLPGVCMIQAVLAALTDGASARVSLSRIVSAKWFAPVKPGEELNFVTRETPAGEGKAVVKARVTCGGKRVAELALDVVRDPAGKGTP